MTDDVPCALQASGTASPLPCVLGKQAVPRQALSVPALATSAAHRKPLAPISVNLHPSQTAAASDAPPSSARATPQRAAPGWRPAPSQEWATSQGLPAGNADLTEQTEQQAGDAESAIMGQRKPEAAQHAIVHVKIPPPPPPPFPSTLLARLLQGSKIAVGTHHLQGNEA